MSSFAETDAALSPSTLILLRARNGLVAFNGPSSAPAADASISRISDIVDGISAVRLSPMYSPDGSILCIVRELGFDIALYNSATGALIGEIPCSDASYLEFSPKGSYLVTWSKAEKGTGEMTGDGNLKVWSVSTRLLVTSYLQKAFKRETLQFTADESLCLRIVSNEVHVLNGMDLNAGVLKKVYHKGLLQFKVSPTCTPFASIAVFNSDKGGNPAKVTLYQYVPSSGEVIGPVSCRTMFSASEASMLWSSTGSALVVHTHSDVDKSNSSYYGTSGLYLLSADGNLSVAVPQSKEGQIHDVKWSPTGDRFVVAAGNMPCHCTLFNHKAESLYEFGAAHRNTISWSPHGRFLVMAGFGNLAGEMDFFDVLRMRKMGSNTAHCAVSHGWSPCSRYFLCATLAPRMNVDNGFKLFKYNGAGPVAHHEIEQAFDAVWRPAASGVYPNRGPSPKREDGSSSSNSSGGKSNSPAPVAAKVEPYRPPNSSGSSSVSDMMRRDRGETGKTKTGVTPQGAASRQRLVPGMAAMAVAAPADPAKAALKKEADKQKKVERKKREEEAALLAAQEESAAALAAKPTVLTAGDVAGLSAEEREKRAKAIRKKLKGIEEVKEKRTAGTKLDAGQLSKLSSEADLLRDLALLSG